MIAAYCCICDKPMRHPMVRRDDVQCGSCAEFMRVLNGLDPYHGVARRRAPRKGTPTQRRLRATRAIQQFYRTPCGCCGLRFRSCRCPFDF